MAEREFWMVVRDGVPSEFLSKHGTWGVSHPDAKFDSKDEAEEVYRTRCPPGTSGKVRHF